MSYKLLILGLRNEIVGIDNCNDCFSFIALKVFQHFKAIPGVTVSLGNVRKDLNMIAGQDMVLFVGYHNDFGEVRARTPKRKLLTLLEGPIAGSDWSFSFSTPDVINATKVVAPVAKDMCVDVPKEKVIVVDHCWLSEGHPDWTFRISEWLTGIKDRYTIYRMLYYGHDREMATVKPHERVIGRLPVKSYLDVTSKAETFVCTHRESYGFGIVEMAARGIRVLIPPNMMNEDLVGYLGCPVFNNREELLAMVQSPVEARWKSMVKKCTDYSEVARMIDLKCKELLGK